MDEMRRLNSGSYLYYSFLWRREDVFHWNLIKCGIGVKYTHRDFFLASKNMNMNIYCMYSDRERSMKTSACVDLIGSCSVFICKSALHHTEKQLTHFDWEYAFVISCNIDVSSYMSKSRDSMKKLSIEGWCVYTTYAAVLMLFSSL